MTPEKAFDHQAEVDMMEAQSGEIHDLSPGTFRFIFVFLAALAVLMLAGVL